MDKSYLLQEYTLNNAKLLKYGFVLHNGIYQLEKIIENINCSFKICITNKSFDIAVYDKLTNERYILFDLKESSGSFVGPLKEKAEELLIDICNSCFDNLNIKSRIITYITNFFEINPSYPFKKYPNHIAFTNKKGKWFALILDVPAKRLNIGGDEIITILNLKGDPNKITQLIDNKIFFPAYHMHKKLWYSILLNKDIDIQIIKNCISESHQLVHQSQH